MRNSELVRWEHVDQVSTRGVRAINQGHESIRRQRNRKLDPVTALMGQFIPDLRYLGNSCCVKRQHSRGMCVRPLQDARAHVRVKKIEPLPGGSKTGIWFCTLQPLCFYASRLIFSLILEAWWIYPVQTASWYVSENILDRTQMAWFSNSVHVVWNGMSYISKRGAFTMRGKSLQDILCPYG